MTAQIIQLPTQEIGESDRAYQMRLVEFRQDRGWITAPIAPRTPEQREADFHWKRHFESARAAQ